MFSNVELLKIMKKLVDSNSAWFALYFVVLLLISALVRDIPDQPNLLENISDFMDPARKLKLGDPYSFATGALDIFHFGWLRDEDGWLFRLWPPGFMLAEGWVLRIFGLDAPFIFILIILNSACAASLLLLIRKKLLLGMPTQFAGLLPLLPFCFSIPRLFLLEPVGIILGEGFAIIFFLTAMMLMTNAVHARSWPIAVAAGLMLALSAYFRSQFELLIMVLTVLAALLLLLFVCGVVVRRNYRHQALQNGRLWLALTVTLALLVCHLSMLPWRITNYFDPYAQNLSWVQTSQLVYANAGKTDNQLLEAGGEWIVHGGGNLACTLESSYCAKADKESFYHAFFKHMDQWYARKLATVGEYWFSSTIDFTLPKTAPTFLENAANLIYLMCVLATLPLLWRARRHPDAAIHWWFCCSFYSCFFVVFTFVHFETRYFYAVKIFSVFSVLLLSGMAWQMRGRAELSDAAAALLNNDGVK